jgi:hypothetical protein
MNDTETLKELAWLKRQELIDNGSFDVYVPKSHGQMEIDLANYQLKVFRDKVKFLDKYR